MKNQFTLKQIFLIVTLASVFFLFVSFAFVGYAWVIGLMFGLLFLAVVFAMFFGSFLLLESASAMTKESAEQQIATASPFRGEVPAKMPDLPEQPNLAEVVPGWNSADDGAGDLNVPGDPNKQASTPPGADGQQST